jgi:glycosyltransferase involved in cell wall biosynthesis
MKILVAPLHYVADPNVGSEYSRSYENLEAIAQDPSMEGDVLVGYCPDRLVGKFRIHTFFKTKPSYVSSFTKLLFVMWVTVKGFQLLRTRHYDAIWHQGPFALDETFSFLSLFRDKRIPFVVGPIYTPHVEEVKKAANYAEHKSNGTIVKVSMLHALDVLFYTRFAKIFTWLSRKSLSNASMAIAIDTMGMRMLEDRHIGNRILLPVTINPTRYFNKPKSLTGTKRELLTVSYLIPRKGIDDLLQALRLLQTSHSQYSYHLTIVGDGPDRGKLEALTRSLSLTDAVTFTGFVPRTKTSPYYRKADIFVSGSISDIMPGMYFEAMNAALPMVLASNETADELRDRNYGGITVDRHNPKQLANAIEKIASDPKLYRDFSAKNRLLMDTVYSYTQNIAKIKKLFHV